MKLREWYFYDLSTGLFTGKCVRAKDKGIVDLALKKRAACGAKEGPCNPFQQRVDLNTGEVIQCDVTKTSNERRQARENAEFAIRALEAKELRPLRELALNSEDANARQRLAEIEEEIAKHRAVINGETDTNAR